MRRRITRAELLPNDGKWKIIISTSGPEADTVAYGDSKDHVKAILYRMLDALGQTLPKKPNWDRPDKVIYYWRI